MTTRQIFDARSQEGPIWKSSGSHIPTSRHKIQILDLHPEALSIPCSHVTRGPRCEFMIGTLGVDLVAVAQECDLGGGAREGRGQFGTRAV